MEKFTFSLLPTLLQLEESFNQMSTEKRSWMLARRISPASMIRSLYPTSPAYRWK